MCVFFGGEGHQSLQLVGPLRYLPTLLAVLLCAVGELELLVSQSTICRITTACSSTTSKTAGQLVHVELVYSVFVIKVSVLSGTGGCHSCKIYVRGGLLQLAGVPGQPKVASYRWDCDAGCRFGPRS